MAKDPSGGITFRGRETHPGIGKTRHGLRVSRFKTGAMPKEFIPIRDWVRRLRRDLEQEVIAVYGEVTPLQAAYIDSCCMAEQACEIIRWCLRHKFKELSPLDLAMMGEKMLKHAKDRARELEKLGLDRDQKGSLSAVYWSEREPALPDISPDATDASQTHADIETTEEPVEGDNTAGSAAPATSGDEPATDADADGETDASDTGSDVSSDATTTNTVADGGTDAGGADPGDSEDANEPLPRNQHGGTQ